MPRLTLVQALNRALTHAMAADPSILVIGEEVAGGAGADGARGEEGGAFGVTRGLYAQFGPERVIDTPISEAALVGLAAGAAACGLRPVLDLMFADFVGTGFDPILNGLTQAPALYDRPMPVVLRMAYGAGDASGAQHSQALHALLTHLPDLLVLMPATPADAEGLLLAALGQDRPVALLEHKALYQEAGDCPETPVLLPLARARQVCAGADVTVLATGLMAVRAAAAAQTLAAAGIALDLLDLRGCRPLDEAAILASLAKTGRLLVVDEGRPRCGFGADLIAWAAIHGFADLRAAPRLLAPPDTPVPFAPALETAWLPDAAVIAAAARALMAA